MYWLLKIWVRLGLYLYCRKVLFSVVPPKNGPVILACNHPNSFLDALIIGSHYPSPIHFLARGDVFAKPFVGRALRRMNMIPIHRLSEGRTGLQNNKETFDECTRVLKEKGTLLIFSEGICKNEMGLRQLKKGTARLAYMAWHLQKLTGVTVLPVALSYSSFYRLPVNVVMNSGKPITRNNILNREPALFYNEFNGVLYEALKGSLPAEKEVADTYLVVWQQLLLAIPACIGWLTHVGLYRLLKRMAKNKTAGTVFYHSVLFGLLLIVYPVVLLLVAGIAVAATHQPFYWLLLLILPFTAWCYKEYKR